MATVKVTLIKSVSGRLPNHKLCVKGLGLRRIGHTVEVQGYSRKPRDDQQGLLHAEGRGLIDETQLI